MKNNQQRNAEFLLQHTQLLMQSYQHWTGKALIAVSDDLIQDLLTAPLAVASHDAQADPLFNYANHQALALFKMSADAMLDCHLVTQQKPCCVRRVLSFCSKWQIMVLLIIILESASLKTAVGS